YAPDSAGIAPDTFIEFRQGYYLISEPQLGTLLIRNSSPLFGRDLFDHPAYYSRRGIDNGFSRQALLDLTPATVSRYFQHCVSVDLHQEHATWQVNSNIAALINQL